MDGRPEEGPQQFFFDKAHGVKMARIAMHIVEKDLPMSGKSIRIAMTDLGITHLQKRNEQEIHGIVKVLRETAKVV